MTTDAPRYFFSYARSDSEFVLRLARELRAAGAGIWIDQLDILGGERWDQAIERALGSCQGIIVVLSPQSVSSENVMDEVSFALEAKKLIVPVIKAECEVPFRLRRLQDVKFTTDFHAGLGELLKALRIQRASQPDEGSSIRDEQTARPSANNGVAPGATLVSPPKATDRGGHAGATPAVAATRNLPQPEMVRAGAASNTEGSSEKPPKVPRQLHRMVKVAIVLISSFFLSLLLGYLSSYLLGMPMGPASLLLQLVGLAIAVAVWRGKVW